MKHALVQYAEGKLEFDFATFRDNGGLTWTELEISMLRYQQACNICKDPRQADASCEAALLACISEAESWAELLALYGSQKGESS